MKWTSLTSCQVKFGNKFKFLKSFWSEVIQNSDVRGKWSKVKSEKWTLSNCVTSPSFYYFTALETHSTWITRVSQKILK